jgi:predicted transglutaminase-like cysteine proteinase
MQLLARQQYGQKAERSVQQWRALLRRLDDAPAQQQLKQINNFFNRRIRFMDDIEIWQTEDYWATPLETLGRAQGDCEDFTIAKYSSLLLLGIPQEKLRLTYVKARRGGPNSKLTQAHMVLAYYPEPGATPLILDNLIGRIRPANRRPDLTPVYSFNSAGLWVGGAAKPALTNPETRLSRWRDLLARMQDEGLQLF